MCFYVFQFAFDILHLKYLLKILVTDQCDLSFYIIQVLSSLLYLRFIDCELNSWLKIMNYCSQIKNSYSIRCSESSESYCLEALSDKTCKVQQAVFIIFLNAKTQSSIYIFKKNSRAIKSENKKFNPKKQCLFYNKVSFFVYNYKFIMLKLI